MRTKSNESPRLLVSGIRRYHTKKMSEIFRISSVNVLFYYLNQEIIPWIKR